MKRGPIIAGLAGLVLIIAIVVGLIMPKLTQVKDTNRQVAVARAQQVVLETQLASLENTAKDAEAIERQLEVLEAQVPPTADLPGLIRLLNDTAAQSAVDFMSISPGQPYQPAVAVLVPSTTTPGPTPSPSPAPAAVPPPAGVSIMPVQITVTGDYFAVDEYLFRLEILPRVSKVINFALVAGPNGLPQLQLQITANFFTTDTSAGPGSLPGGQGGIPTAPPSPTPTPSGSASPNVSPSGSGSPSVSPSISPSVNPSPSPTNTAPA